MKKSGLVTYGKVYKIRGERANASQDLIAVEEPLQIRLEYVYKEAWHEKNLMVTMRSPGHDFDLAMGFLFAEGIIQGEKDILWMRYCEKVKKEEQGNVLVVRLADGLDFDSQVLDRNFYTHSSCGVCGKTAIDAVQAKLEKIRPGDNKKMSYQTLFTLQDAALVNQTGFKYTGGLHAASLFDSDGNLILLREDVGRHNALDKLVGAALREGMSLQKDRIVVLSGRVSFEMVQKAVRAGIPMLAAAGAPTNLSVDLAEDKGLTLIGFLKKDRFNIYTHAGRIMDSG
ncbi:formate dehydrogenase accessory sulfurtransferase FdhD [Negadavirga shengliensis]|uniref:Sulfur carrier protein FdhD n=1 Tax=Negadavirga shengliensis TaxID=1389218 RepID=A0ABV9SXI6_9BACT